MAPPLAPARHASPTARAGPACAETGSSKAPSSAMAWAASTASPGARSRARAAATRATSSGCCVPGRGLHAVAGRRDTASSSSATRARRATPAISVRSSGTSQPLRRATRSTCLLPDFAAESPCRACRRAAATAVRACLPAGEPCSGASMCLQPHPATREPEPVADPDERSTRRLCVRSSSALVARVAPMSASANATIPSIVRPQCQAAQRPSSPATRSTPIAPVSKLAFTSRK
jgi:hypothetical protein